MAFDPSDRQGATLRTMTTFPDGVDTPLAGPLYHPCYPGAIFYLTKTSLVNYHIDPKHRDRDEVMSLSLPTLNYNDVCEGHLFTCDDKVVMVMFVSHAMWIFVKSPESTDVAVFTVSVLRQDIQDIIRSSNRCIYDLLSVRTFFGPPAGTESLRFTWKNGHDILFAKMVGVQPDILLRMPLPTPPSTFRGSNLSQDENTRELHCCGMPLQFDKHVSLPLVVGASCYGDDTSHLILTHNDDNSRDLVLLKLTSKDDLAKVITSETQMCDDVATIVGDYFSR